MSERFRSLLVRRPHHVRREGGRVEGHYTVPLTACSFPASLMAEAVGQLAAWSAMAQLDFAFRPVAGLASEARYRRSPRPGRRCSSGRHRALRSRGRGLQRHGRCIDGQLALELVDSVGPMLPMEEFDAPDAVRADFHTLLDAGAAPGRFGGVPLPELQIEVQSDARRAAARHAAGARSQRWTPYFDDHFPRRPVFPGTLLIDALAGLSVQLARKRCPRPAADALMPTRSRNVKIRSFTAPGATLELEIDAAGRRARARPAEARGAQRGQDHRHGAHRGRPRSRRSPHEHRRRVAITGLGLVTPVGNDVASDLVRTARRRAAVWRRSRSFDASGFPGAHRRRGQGPVRRRGANRPIGDRKLLKFANRSHRFALVAAAQAFADAGIRPDARRRPRAGAAWSAPA